MPTQQELQRTARKKNGTPKDERGEIEDGVAAEKATQTMKIAIVDDDKDTTMLYGRALQFLGYENQLVAHDGTEIVDAIENRGARPDIIIMDCHMPKMDGLKAASRIRALDKSIQIILATADESAMHEATEMGLRSILKPFTISKLDEMLRPIA